MLVLLLVFGLLSKAFLDLSFRRSNGEASLRGEVIVCDGRMTSVQLMDLSPWEIPKLQSY